MQWWARLPSLDRPGLLEQSLRARDRDRQKSRKIDGAYQDVLTWARQHGDAAPLWPGSPDRARPTATCVASCAHLRPIWATQGRPTMTRQSGDYCANSQILVFDFTAQGSASEELAMERSVRALHPDDAVRAGSLWTTLVELALHVAASGGDRARDRLIEDLGISRFALSATGATHPRA